MTRSKQEVPHFCISAAVDMTGAIRIRQSINDALRGNVHISFKHMVIKASALALIDHSLLNSRFSDEGIHIQRRINVGVAIALEGGLVAPAILDCGHISLVDIARMTSDLLARAQLGKLTAAELSAPTFTVRNLGKFGIDNFQAITTPPQVAALAVGAIREKPVVREGAVTTAAIMRLTLSVDHRVVDGAQAARFLGDIRTYLEKPG
jgi:pyruvate dehydrogenase E2 component (dihydrolipoamide acetyltransferase)